MKILLISFPYFTDEQKAALQKAAEDAGAECLAAPEDKVTPQMLGNVDAVIGNVPIELLRGNTNLEWMQLPSSGVDKYLKEGVPGKNTVLTSSTGAFGVSIAEYMVAMLLNMMKKTPLYNKDQMLAVWRDEGGVTSPCGKRVLVIGTGNIGTEFAKRMRAFGCRLVGLRRHGGKCPPEFDELHTAYELRDEVEKADVIALSLPGTKLTHHLFDEGLLMRCKEGAYLMNVGRGDVIDTKALEKRRVYEHFAGIWLDVFEEEPLPSRSRLYHIPNLLVTPHITGGYHLDLTISKIFDISLHNLKAWLGDGEYFRVVDRDAGYVISQETV